MIKKILFVSFLGLTVFFNSPVFAHPMKGECESGECSGKMQKGQSQCPIVNKFMMKAHYLLENKAELGLSEDQIKTIKDLKLQVEKNGISQGADMQTFMLDLQSKLNEDTVDVAGIDAMIDRGFASATVSTKANVDAYAKLKSVLTPDQTAKMKAIHEAEEKKEDAEEKEEHNHKH